MVAGVRTQGQAARNSPAARSPLVHASTTSSEQLLMQFVKEMMAELREIRKDVNRSRSCSCPLSGRSSRATSPSHRLGIRRTNSPGGGNCFYHTNFGEKAIR